MANIISNLDGEFKTLPKWCWNQALECVVEVLSAGNYPDTILAKTPEGRTIQCYIKDLRTLNQIKAAENSGSQQPLGAS